MNERRSQQPPNARCRRVFPAPRIRGAWPSLARILSLALACLGTPVTADSPDLALHGFASQSLIDTSSNAFAGGSQDVSWQFRTLGLNGTYRVSPELFFATQIVSHRFGEVNRGAPHIDYALVDYQLATFPKGRLNLRAGRVKNPIGLYNETRDVPSTLPSIVLPQSIYLERSRALMLASDAVFVHGEAFLDRGHWQLDAGLGYPQSGDEEVERIVMLNRNWDGSLKGELSHLIRLLYESPDGTVRLAATHTTANMRFEAHANDVAFGLDSGDVDISYAILSAHYEARDWSLSGEFLRTRSRVAHFGALLPDGVIDGDNFYVQGTWSPRYDVELLLRYDETIHDNDDPDGIAAAATSPARVLLGLPGVAAHNNYARDWTLGARWSINANWTLRAEHHWVEGTSWLSRTDNPDIANTTENWRMFALSLDYRF